MGTLPRRILVCRIDNLGDVLMVLPALRWLKAQPRAPRIEMVVRDYARAMTQRCPWVDRVWTPEEVAQAVGAGDPAPDAVFHLQSTRALLKDCARWGIALRMGNLLRSAHWGRCNRWVAFSKRRMREHESALAWRFFAPVFGAGPSAAQWQALLQQGDWLGGSFAHVASARHPAQATPALQRGAEPPLHVLLHPGSNGNGRQWPLPHFTALAQALLGGGHRVGVTGAAAERAALQAWLATLPAGVDDHIGRHSLADFIDLIGSADCLVASGTGPLHIAGASGTHAVGIFPPRVPIGALRWRPIGPRVTTLQAAEPAICTRACTNLDCACMAAVTPGQVLSAVLAAPTPQA
jgi:ADP-heptose:LPS heptosyltransferase